MEQNLVAVSPETEKRAKIDEQTQKFLYSHVKKPSATNNEITTVWKLPNVTKFFVGIQAPLIVDMFSLRRIPVPETHKEFRSHWNSCQRFSKSTAKKKRKHSNVLFPQFGVWMLGWVLNTQHEWKCGNNVPPTRSLQKQKCFSHELKIRGKFSKPQKLQATSVG